MACIFDNIDQDFPTALRATMQASKREEFAVGLPGSAPADVRSRSGGFVDQVAYAESMPALSKCSADLVDERLDTHSDLYVLALDSIHLFDERFLSRLQQ